MAPVVRYALQQPNKQRWRGGAVDRPRLTMFAEQNDIMPLDA